VEEHRRSPSEGGAKGRCCLSPSDAASALVLPSSVGADVRHRRRDLWRSRHGEGGWCCRAERDVEDGGHIVGLSVLIYLP
jgi:hypothetical protein